MEIGIAYDLVPESGADGPVDRFEEYDSRATIDAVASALSALGHRPRCLGGGRRFLSGVLARPPELLFNMAEGFGRSSREAQVPSVCEMLAIPYTHSDPLTLTTTLDKPTAKRLVRDYGLRTPRFAVVQRPDQELALRFPLIAKPVAEGSSMGLRVSSRVVDGAALRDQVARLLRDYGQPVLVEEFCPGPEFTVGVLGTGDAAAPIGVMEIAPRDRDVTDFVYSIEVKRMSDAAVEYRVPPAQPEPLVRAVAEFALAAYRALDCRDVARIDVRVDRDGEPAFLEANPLPGLRPAWGDIVILAERSGLSFEALIGRIVDAARARLQI